MKKKTNEELNRELLSEIEDLIASQQESDWRDVFQNLDSLERELFQEPENMKSFPVLKTK